MRSPHHHSTFCPRCDLHLPIPLLMTSPRLPAHRYGYSSGPATGTVHLGSSTTFLWLPYRLVVTPLDVYCHRNALRHIVARHLDPIPGNTSCCSTRCIGPPCFLTSSHFFHTSMSSACPRIPIRLCASSDLVRWAFFGRSLPYIHHEIASVWDCIARRNPLLAPSLPISSHIGPR